MAAVAWVFGLFGLVSLLLAVSRLAAARRLAATGHAVLAALLIGAAVVTGVLAADLASYQPREGDRPIAELYLEQVGTRRYRATLTRLPGGRMQVFELAGDAWRVGRPHARLRRLGTGDRWAPGVPARTAGRDRTAHDGRNALADRRVRTRSAGRLRSLAVVASQRTLG